MFIDLELTRVKVISCWNNSSDWLKRETSECRCQRCYTAYLSALWLPLKFSDSSQMWWMFSRLYFSFTKLSRQRKSDWIFCDPFPCLRNKRKELQTKRHIIEFLRWIQQNINPFDIVALKLRSMQQVSRHHCEAAGFAFWWSMCLQELSEPLKCAY